jgi:hypothetical protein
MARKSAVLPPSSQDSSSPLSGALTPLLVVCATAAVGWKLYKLCVVRVTPDVLTVVYDTRRRSILTSSATPSDAVPHCAKQQKSFSENPLFWCLRYACKQRSSSYLIAPPSMGMYQVFRIPRSALTPTQGIRIRCVVEDIIVRDGTVKMVLTACGYVDSRELDRYLAVVGPVPPMEAIGRCVSDVLNDSFNVTLERNVGLQVTAGLLLDTSKWTAGGALMEAFSTKLRACMVTSCCVVLRDVVVEAVELVGSTSTMLS